MPASWSHRLVRPLARPLIRLGATPNQVTTVRLAVGLAGVAALAWGTPTARLWGGVLWLLCCLFDRLDGEIARIGNMCSPAGEQYDTAVDRWTAALFFFGLGLSLHAGPHPWVGALFGALAFASQQGACLVADQFDLLSPSDKVIPSRWGFDADDALYILGPLAWLPDGWRLTAIVLAGIGTTAFLSVFWLRLSRLRRRLGRPSAALDDASSAART